tara:strand:+ start:3921 stop:5804 length:1884 start_codon:yes stop_codon:yes gene_type:complete
VKVKLNQRLLNHLIPINSMKKLLILFFTLLLLTNFALAEPKKGHIKLLAVQELPNGTFEGGLADLFLEINPGSGRVFLETFPLTKTDTQMSTRFAKTIACDFTGIDCKNFDFFYTISSDSPIIAGPSAGSSISALTIALLLDAPIDTTVAGTGTINSGGLVGPVGGVKAKITAAAKYGLTKVLIPDGESVGREENETIDLGEFSNELGIEIITVSTIDEIVEHLTGIKKEKKNISIDINQGYSSKMRALSEDLCQRGEELQEIFDQIPPIDNKIDTSLINLTIINKDIENLTIKGENAFENQEYYSSASYCFGANVQLDNLILQSKNYSENQIIVEVSSLKKNIDEFSFAIDQKQKKTITDLETYMVVKERLIEANEVAEDVLETLNTTNSTAIATRVLAYGLERYNSAISWSSFFDSQGKEFILNEEVLKKSCQDKLSEVEERVQYAELYLPNSLDNVRYEKEKAYTDLQNKNYALCLFKASKAKASVDVVLGIFGVEPDHYEKFLEKKLEIVKQNLAEQSLKGIFPIIGYSYYEYANSLKNTNTVSGLLYSEYALEIGNLDIYFETESNDKPIFTKSLNLKDKIDTKFFVVLIIGILVGLISGIIIRKKPKPNKLEVTIHKHRGK